MCFEAVEAAVKDIRAGKMVIVVDEEDRENEGDLTMAAEKVTAESINFMAKHGRGLICMPMTGRRLDELRIPEMVQTNESVHGTAFCVSIEARRNVSTGISASDRAMTILTAIHPSTKPEDLIRPGHIFPLRAREGGVLERAGQTEASVDLARMAGLAPAGVICEIMNDDGTMARMKDLVTFAKKHGLRIVSVVDLIKYRLRTERFIRRLEALPFETEFGVFDLYVYQSQLDSHYHLALVKGDLDSSEPVLVRVHTESVLGDVFSSTRLGSASEVRSSLRMIQEAGAGVFIYLQVRDKDRQFLREIEALKADGTSEDDHTSFKDYGIGAQIIADLGITEVRLLTNHPKRLFGLEGFNIEIVDQVPIPDEYQAVTRELSESVSSTR